MNDVVLGAAFGAFIGSGLTGLVAYFLQNEQLKHARRMQQDQWNMESEWRRHDQQHQTGLQKREIDASTRQQAREWDNKLSEIRESTSRSALIEVQKIFPEHVLLCRRIYVARVKHEVARKNQEKYADEEQMREDIGEYVTRHLHVLAAVSRIQNEDLRNVFLDLYWLGNRMTSQNPDPIIRGDYPSLAGRRTEFELTRRTRIAIQAAGLAMQGVPYDHLKVEDLRLDTQSPDL